MVRRVAACLAALLQVDHGLVGWITDYLTNRPQYVRLLGSLSDELVSSTGAPQGTVLSPFLFPLYTSDILLQFQYVPPTEVLRCLLDRQLHHGRKRGGVQNSGGEFCRVV